MDPISFITNDESIRGHLATLGHINSKNSRKDLVKSFIPGNFCRGESGLTESLKKFVINEETTVIFVNGGHEILGMAILNIKKSPNPHLELEVICAPESKKGIGTMLLNCVKNLAKSIQLPVFLLSLNESLNLFYKNQGFDKYDGDSGYYVFNQNASAGGKKAKKSRKVRKVRKSRKSRKSARRNR